MSERVGRYGPRRRGGRINLTAIFVALPLVGLGFLSLFSSAIPGSYAPNIVWAVSASACPAVAPAVAPLRQLNEVFVSKQGFGDSSSEDTASEAVEQRATAGDAAEDDAHDDASDAEGVNENENDSIDGGGVNGGENDDENETFEKERQESYLTVCMKVWNEGAKLVEFIEFHRLQGVDRFVVYVEGNFYDHEAAYYVQQTELLQELYEQRGFPELIILEQAASAIQSAVSLNTYGRGADSEIHRTTQVACYNHCLRKYGPSTEWLLMIDGDEFVSIGNPAGRPPNVVLTDAAADADADADADLAGNNSNNSSVNVDSILPLVENPEYITFVDYLKELQYSYYKLTKANKKSEVYARIPLPEERGSPAAQALVAYGISDKATNWVKHTKKNTPEIHSFLLPSSAMSVNGHMWDFWLDFAKDPITGFVELFYDTRDRDAVLSYEDYMDFVATPGIDSIYAQGEKQLLEFLQGHLTSRFPPQANTTVPLLPAKICQEPSHSTLSKLCSYLTDYAKIAALNPATSSPATSNIATSNSAISNSATSKPTGTDGWDGASSMDYYNVVERWSRLRHKVTPQNRLDDETLENVDEAFVTLHALASFPLRLEKATRRLPLASAGDSKEFIRAEVLKHFPICKDFLDAWLASGVSWWPDWKEWRNGPHSACLVAIRGPTETDITTMGKSMYWVGHLRRIGYRGCEHPWIHNCGLKTSPKIVPEDHIGLDAEAIKALRSKPKVKPKNKSLPGDRSDINRTDDGEHDDGEKESDELKDSAKEEGEGAGRELITGGTQEVWFEKNNEPSIHHHILRSLQKRTVSMASWRGKSYVTRRKGQFGPWERLAHSVDDRKNLYWVSRVRDAILALRPRPRIIPRKLASSVVAAANQFHMKIIDDLYIEAADESEGTEQEGGGKRRLPQAAGGAGKKKKYVKRRDDVVKTILLPANGSQSAASCDAGDVLSQRKIMCPKAFPFLGRKMPTADGAPTTLLHHAWCSRLDETPAKTEDASASSDASLSDPLLRRSSAAKPEDIVACGAWPEASCCAYNEDYAQAFNITLENSLFSARPTDFKVYGKPGLCVDCPI